LGDLDRLDLAVYAAIAATPTPTLDRAFRRLSRAADHSKL
jgi:undecaprenyl-diphosphatase